MAILAELNRLHITATIKILDKAARQKSEK